MTMRKPAGRPTTRKVAKPGTTRAAAPRPQTGPQRAVRGAPASKPNTGLIVGGIAGGVVVLILIAFVVMGSGKSKPEKEAPATAPAKEKKPVDVRELVDKGMKSGAEGYALIISCQSDMNRAGSLDGARKADLKKKLQEGVRLIKQAGEYLDDASTKTGKVEGDYRKEWGEARKAANNFIQNLGP
jgi:hypothetical protein